VFKATLNGELVAAKRLQAQEEGFSEDFYKEVDTLMGLRHPNVISFIGIFVKDLDRYMVTDFMNQGSLKSLLLSKGDEMEPSDVCFFAKEICKGMSYLGSKNLVHRDLRADNILVNEVDGHFWVKIGDFGLARKIGASKYYTKSGNSLDPVKWSAPEIFAGKASPASDVWSFGVLLWELFVRCKNDPFSDMTNHEVKEKVSKGISVVEDLSLPLVFASISEIISTCVVFNGHDRTNFTTIHDKLIIIEEKMHTQEPQWPEIVKVEVVSNLPYDSSPYVPAKEEKEQ